MGAGLGLAAAGPPLEAEEDAVLLLSSRSLHVVRDAPLPGKLRWRRLLKHAGFGVGFVLIVVTVLGLVTGRTGRPGTEERPPAGTSDGGVPSDAADVLGANTADCWWSEHRGYLIPGNNIAVHHALFLDTCMTQCRTNKDCRAVEFANSIRNTGDVYKSGDCILQSKGTGRKNYSSVMGYRNIDLYISDSCHVGTARTGSGVREADLRSKRIAEEQRRAREAVERKAKLKAVAEREAARKKAAEGEATDKKKTGGPNSTLYRGSQHGAEVPTTPTTPTSTPAPTTSSTSPCIPQRTLQGPSLFCFSVMTPGGEVALVTSQFKRKASIFACNDFAVISCQKLDLGPDECGRHVTTWANPALQPVGIGNLNSAGVTTNSFLNTDTFIKSWDMLMNSNAIWKHAWIAKVDPDAVFFPDRLRAHVAPHTGPPQYVLNCLWSGTAKIFGAVEVFSIPAIVLYHQKPWVCKNMGWHGWGEDYYMEKCMAALGATALVDYDMVGDGRCRGAVCTDKRVAAYHPYKDIGAYWSCWDQSNNAPNVPPPR